MSKEFLREDFEQNFSRHSERAWELEVLGETESTMTIARERAKKGGVTQPFMAIAASQSGGRGRQGRVWNSGPGGFYATFMFATGKAMADLGGFSLVVGVVIRRILEAEGVTIALKWPNDLVSSEGRKLGGILIEVLPVTGDSLLLVGIGVNFDNSIDPALAISLRELGAKNLSVPEFAARLGTGLDQALHTFGASGLTTFLTDWRAADFLQGREIEIDDAGKTISGCVRGINEQGALRLDIAGEQRDIWSGHILSISGLNRS